MNILITGANQGIGYYMVIELLEQGHTVTVLDIDISELLNLVNEYPNKVLPILCDVRNTENMQKSIKQSVNTCGTIDIAIHNACICTFQSMEDDYFLTDEALEYQSIVKDETYIEAIDKDLYNQHDIIFMNHLNDFLLEAVSLK